MTEDIGYYEGHCPVHKLVSQHLFNQSLRLSSHCTEPNCNEVVTWVRQKPEHSPTEPECNLHYLILRYNGGQVEVFKGEEYKIRALFIQFKGDAIRVPPRKKVYAPEINLILDISELHSVQMVGDDEGSEILDSLVPPDNDLPYYYPELRETK